MKLLISSVDTGPDELTSALPINARLVRQLPGPDRPDYWLVQIVSPLSLQVRGKQIECKHAVIAARFFGYSLDLPTVSIAIGFAIVVDDAQIIEPEVKFQYIEYLAVCEASINEDLSPKSKDTQKANQGFWRRLSLFF